MADPFEDIFAPSPIDPTEAARRAVRPTLRKRFYKDVGVAEAPEGLAVTLDGRPVRTPARRPLAAPTRPLGEALAAEWDAQADVVDPARMPLTRLANTIIDGVAAAPGTVAAEVAKYLGSDLLFYRAAGPERLVARQQQHWDPVFEWAQTALGAHFLTGTGVMPLLQPGGPSAPVVIAGAGMPDDLATLASAAGAQPRGFLPSVEAELAMRRISIAPLRFGAGLKGKVGESLAAGVPVVATTIAGEGFDRPERGMLIADSAAGFAAAIERLCGDDELWARLSEGGRELVAETLGTATCEAALERILAALHARRAA